MYLVRTVYAVVVKGFRQYGKYSLTKPIIEKNYTNLNEIFDDDHEHNILLALTKKLKIRIW